MPWFDNWILRFFTVNIYFTLIILNNKFTDRVKFTSLVFSGHWPTFALPLNSNLTKRHFNGKVEDAFLGVE